jgi:quercetin dioxygenase-like cupin family protein
MIGDSMIQYKTEFDKIPWQTPMIGMRHKFIDQNGIRLRLVEYSKDMPAHWCEKGHFGYLIEGKMEIEFENLKEIYKAGDGIFLPNGPGHKHTGKVSSVRLKLLTYT